MDNWVTLTIEVSSAILILCGFELFNRQNVKAFWVMGVGQFLAMVVCAVASLWFLSLMHFVNFILQIRGFIRWSRTAPPHV
jgi:hypothetical protein